MKPMFPLMGALLLSFTAQAHLHEKSDSGIEGKPYRDQVRELKAIANQYPALATLISYGTSYRSRELLMLKIRVGANHRADLPAVFISGATHGNEYMNLVDRMPKWILSEWQSWNGVSDYLVKGGTIYLVPILNPDGYDRDRRANARGNDLNRDFDLIPENERGFTQKETRLLVETLERDLAADSARLKVAMDYHCCIGAWLYPWSYTRRALPRADLTGHRRIPLEAIRDGFTHYQQGTTPDVLGYRPRGTSKDYYYARFGALAFTFEGKRRVEARNFALHQRKWDRILQGLADQIPAKP